MDTTATGGVSVEVKNFVDLFGHTQFPLAMDTYQRGFVWNDEKIGQLMDDLATYQREADPKPAYYMGSILIHRNVEKGHCFIIDGQQRLTALCLLHMQLLGDLPENCALSYSPQSSRRIRAAIQAMREHANGPHADIFRAIVFTVISVDQVDLAFTFFDTQNNRGVPLDATDLLKAYHLRAVDGPVLGAKEALQKICATRWERIQQGAQVMSHDGGFTPNLFSKFLWRARRWTGPHAFFGNHDALMDEFQNHTWKPAADPAIVPLYGTRRNRLGVALRVCSDGHNEIHGNRILLSSMAEDLPFAIRQPIQKGVGFFLYSDKYAALIRKLVVKPTESAEIARFQEVYATLLMANSVFLREIFLLAALMYLDQFGDQQLWEFSLWLEYALGMIRLGKQQVRYEAAQNFFKNGNPNLLDLVAGAYLPEQVIAPLRVLRQPAAANFGDEIEPGKGVQGVYKKAVLEYFGQASHSSLRSKHVWIANRLHGRAK